MSSHHSLSPSQVVGCAPTFEPDILPGFEKATLGLPEEDDGPLAATLVRKSQAESGVRPAVLYVHGFVDYFFQTHLADAFENAGYRFYALDLRRYGRSLRPGNRACMAWNVSDYFPELTWATNWIATEHGKIAGLVAHSTGGLITSLYLSTRRPLHLTDCLVLNSPFLRFYLNGFDRGLTMLAARVARLAPDLLLPQRLPDTYGLSLHKSAFGEWDYDLERKPLAGVPLYTGWFRMIRNAHAHLASGLDLRLPILSMVSDRSVVATPHVAPEDYDADLVLDVNDIRRLSRKLGPNVTLLEFKGGRHDLVLSKKPVREEVLRAMVNFVNEHSS